jgi:hypothetical protein
MKETKAELKAIFEETKDMPGPRIIELQRSLLPLLGYTPDFGVECLNNMNIDYPSDQQLASKFQIYAISAEFAGV